MSWIKEYVGKPWSEKEDCYYWFGKIQAEQFGRSVPLVGGFKRTLMAARLMRGAPVLLGCRETKHPMDGDAVFLSQRENAHHIGIYVEVDGFPWVLHALEGSGVLFSSAISLLQNGWKIEAYWTDRAGED